LPNFRNLGVMLRILLISNSLVILQSFFQASSWVDLAQRLVQFVTVLTPVLLASLLLLWLVQPWLARLRYGPGSLVVMCLVTTVSLSVYKFGGTLYSSPENAKYYFDEARYVLISMTLCTILLLYFRLRSQMLTHALHEARLQVLRARIRPHFLFNTINAVLGIVRAQPKKAETALEDMADLFRMAMSDAKDLVPLSREIELSKQYIALEQLRMGERLSVDWEMKDVPEDAMIPPLLLQPLLENAVYHGIELLPHGGSISIGLSRGGDQLRLSVENPYVARTTAARDGFYFGDAGHPAPQNGGNGRRANNKMALLNIRERLDLLFDAEARYEVQSGNDSYKVEIVLPYVKGSSS
jgi:two-component system sensor histidine kinase AlgZ